MEKNTFIRYFMTSKTLKLVHVNRNMLKTVFHVYKKVPLVPVSE